MPADLDLTELLVAERDEARKRASWLWKDCDDKNKKILALAAEVCQLREMCNQLQEANDTLHNATIPGWVALYDEAHAELERQADCWLEDERGWRRVLAYFEAQPDADRQDSKELIAAIEQRAATVAENAKVLRG